MAAHVPPPSVGRHAAAYAHGPARSDADQEPSPAGPGRRGGVHQGHPPQHVPWLLGRVQRVPPVHPGDDPRYLDWRLFARTDRYYVKRFEDETNVRCHIVLDTSRSMNFRSLDHSKSEYARTAAATIAYFLTLQRDAVGLLTFEDRITDYLPPRHRPGHLRRLLAMLDREPKGRATDLAAPLEEIAATVKKRGLIVLLSDLLAPADALRSRLGYLRSRGHEVIVLRILDPAESSFTFRTPAMFHDLESGRELYIDPDAARAGYLARFAAHAAEIERACTDLAIDFRTITTDSPLELVLFNFLKARLRGAAKVGRRVAAGASRRGAP